MTFAKDFEAKVKKEAKKLVSTNDKILVACSGGKDSTTILYLLKKWGYNVSALHVDLLMGAYSKGHVTNLTNFCKELKIPLHIVNIRDELGASMCYVREKIQSKKPMNNCMICGVIKRSILNKKAKELGANCIVTGHNRDDLAESIIMNVLMGNPRACLGLGAKSGVIESDLFAKRVKPLNYIAEDEIRTYSKEKNFPVIYDPCPCSHNAFRRFVKNLITEYEINQDNVIKLLKKIEPALNKKFKTNEELKKCVNCGEATRNETCKSCEIISIIKK